MMRKKLKQHKAAAVAAAVTLCITAAAGTMAVYGQNGEGGSRGEAVPG